jgi:CYTH domain-containing protein
MAGKQTDTEVERKFLLDRLPDDVDKGERITQGYLVIAADREVRLRRSGKCYFLTVKQGEGRDRQETEVELDTDQFRSLWPLTKGQRVRKRRYRVSLGKLTAEVDAYRRRLKGLITAEIEFPNPEQAEQFEPPEWLGREVTDDKRYRNQNLARDGLPRSRSARRKKSPQKG